MKKRVCLLFLLLGLSLMASIPYTQATPETWDLLEENWDSLGDWEKQGIGTAEISPAGQLHLVTTFVVGVRTTLDSGLPQRFVFEKNMTVDDFDDSKPDGSGFQITTRDGEHELNVLVYSAYVRLLNKTGWDKRELVTEEGVWYVWRFVVNSADDSVILYRNNEYVTEWYEMKDNSVADGLIDFTVMYGEAHEDYWKIATLHKVVFCFNQGGVFRVDNQTITNGTNVLYYNGSVIELASLPQNSSYIFESFNWTGGSSAINPYNFTVSSNVSIWCIFEETPKSRLAVGLLFGVIIGLVIGLVIALGASKH